MSIRYLSGIDVDANTLFVDSANDRVGIGTGSPSFPLTVYHATNSAATFQTAGTGTGAGNGFYVGHTGNISYVWNYNNFPIVLATNNSERLRITAAGNVGIGTTSPTQLLEGYTSTNGDISIQITNPSTGASATAQFFASNGTNRTQFFHTGTSYNGTGVLASAAGLGGIYNNTAQGIALLASSAAGPIKFATTTSNTERMRIASDGNVGIGTTAPLAKIHVEGGGGNGTAWFGGTAIASHFNFSTDEHTYIRGGKLTSSVYIADSNTGNVFIANGGGNVGIGTTAPGQKLQVDGNIYVNDDGTTGNGIMLRGADRPLIARGWDPFTSGNKTGVGRWGVYMESSELFIGAPGTDYSNALITLGGWLLNGTRQPNLTLNNSTQRVGIGTTSPAYKLDVQANTTSEPYVQARFLNTNSSGTEYGGILVNGTNQAHIRFLTGTSTWDGAGAKQWQIRTGFGSNTDALSIYSWTAGAEVIYLNANSNVGIGTTNPGERLHVVGPSNNWAAHFVSGTSESYFSYGAGYGAYINAGSSASSSTYILELISNGSTRMFVRGDGNVGIGTTSPGGRLHIATPDPATNFVAIDFRNPTYGIYGKSNSISGRGNTLEFTATDYNGGSVTTREVLTLRPEGNVGIGTTAPGGKLSILVDGGATWTQYLSTPSAVNKRNSIGFHDSAGANIAAILTDINADNTADFGISVPNGSPRLVIKASGNVGIGNTNPTAKLQVGADAHPSATGIEVAAGASGANLLALDSSTNHNWFPFTDGSNYYSAVSHTFRNELHSTDWMKITAAGNVGIGTTSPNAQLDAFTTQGGSTIAATHGTGGTYPKASGISFGATSTSLSVSNNGGTVVFTGGAGIYANNGAASNNPTELVFWTTSAGSPAARLTIASTGAATFTSSVTASSLIKSGGTSAQYLMADGSVSTTSNVAPRYVATVNVSQTAYTQVCTIVGGSLASAVNMSFQGTSGNVVVNVTAQILVNHFQDIVITTTSGFYSQLNIRIISNSNESYSVEAQVQSGVGATTDLNIEVFPLNSESVTFGGSPLTPGTTLVHSTRSGVYVSATEPMSISSGSDIYAAGNVGIGTTSPGDKLHVNAGATGGIRIQADSEPSLYLNTTDGAANATLFNSYGNVGLVGYATSTNYIMYHYGGGGTLANQYTYFQTAGAERMRINGAGNVGIGTTSPNAKLNVRGSEGSGSVNPQEDLVHVGGNELGGVGGYAGIRIGGAGNTSYGAYIRGVKTSAYGGFWNTALTFSVTRTSTETTIDEAMRISSGANVLIGTTTDDGYKLRVNGTSYFDNLAWFRQNAGSGSAFRWGDLGTAVSTDTMLCMNQLWNGAGWTILNSNAGTTYVNLGSAGASPDITFGTGPANTVATVKMTITNNGNVGIGTTNPLHKLEVGGNISINGGTFLDFANGDVRFVNGSGTLSIQTYSVSTGLTTKATVTGSGNVLIGTTTDAGYKLRVVGSSYTTGDVVVAKTTTANANFGGPVLSLGDSTSEVGMCGGIAFAENLTSSLANVTMGIYYDGKANKMHFTASSDAQATAGENLVAATKHMTITRDTGLVGIGTTAPSEKLDITDGKLRFTNTSSGRNSTIGMDDNFNFYVKNTPAGNLYIGNGTTTYVTGSFNAGGGTVQIPSGGNVIIGSTTDAGYKLDVHGEILGRDDIRILNTYALVLNGTDNNWRIGRNTISDSGWLTSNTMQMVVFGSSSGQGFQVVNHNGTALFEIDGVAGASRFTNALGVGVNPSGTAGRIDASNDIVAYSTSDQRLKENITPIANALDKVKALTGVEFDWKEETKAVHGYEGHDVGVIAQEVQAVLPEAVRTNDSGYLSVRYEKMIALLVEANKELASRVEELEKKLK